MATTTLNISLPDTMRNFVENKIANDGYTISEYVRELIRNDQKKEQSNLEALILEGLNSGEATPFTKSDFDEIRAVVTQRIVARQNAKNK
jgi:antitoxin ParD1/3/4